MESSNKEKTLRDGKEETAVASCEYFLKGIMEKIEHKTMEANELKEITQKQLVNISELQKKCEESFISINHLTQNKSTASERFEKAMKQTEEVQNKQIKVNELLNIAMKKFDENTVMSNKSREQFQSEEDLANQRILIYNANLSQIKALRENIIDSIRNSVRTRASHLKTLKSFIEANNEQKLQSQLSQMKSDINNLKTVNTKYEKDLLQVESELNSIDLKTKALGETMSAKLSSAEEELKVIATSYEEKKQELANVQSNITNVISTNQQLLELTNALNDKINEEKKKSADHLQEIALKKQTLESVKKELEDCLVTCNQHRETVKEVTESEHLCTLSQNRLTQLEDEKERLLQMQHRLNADIDCAKEKIEKTKTDLRDKNSDLEKIKIQWNETNIKVNQLKETDAEEVKSFETKMSAISEEINDLQINKLKKIESIKNKRERLEELKSLLSVENNDCSTKKKEFTDLREKNKVTLLIKEANLNDIKAKCEDIGNELEIKRSELNSKLETKDAILALMEKVKDEKAKHTEMIEKFEKEKNALKTSFNQNLEGRLGELQKMKDEKQTRLDEVKDGASKAEFVYYRDKRLTQRHREEMSYSKEALKTYNCENEMLKMLISWLHTDSDASTGITSSEDIPDITFPEAEDIDNDDMPTQEYTPNKQDNVTKVPTEKYKQGSQKMTDQDNEVSKQTVDEISSQTKVKDINSEENKLASLNDVGVMKVPPIMKRLRRPSIVSTERRAGLSLFKKPRKEAGEKTILDMVIETDSQSSA